MIQTRIDYLLDLKKNFILLTLKEKYFGISMNIEDKTKLKEINKELEKNNVNILSQEIVEYTQDLKSDKDRLIEYQLSIFKEVSKKELRNAWDFILNSDVLTISTNSIIFLCLCKIFNINIDIDINFDYEIQGILKAKNKSISQLSLELYNFLLNKFNNIKQIKIIALFFINHYLITHFSKIITNI